MTQGLLDLTTTLFNNKTEGNNLKSNAKDYAETYSNGKSFNDIFSNANNNYSAKNNASNFRNNRDRNFNNNSQNNNLNKKSLNSNNDQNSSINSNTPNKLGNDDNNSVKNKLTGQDCKNQVQDNSNVSTSQDVKDNSSVDEVSENASDSTVVLKDTFAIDDLDEVNLDNFASSEDILAFVQSPESDELMNSLVEHTEVADVDLCVNAFYQSTLDALSTEAVAETDVESDVVDAITEVPSEEVTLATAKSTEDVTASTSETTTTVDVNKTDFNKSVDGKDANIKADNLKNDTKDEALSKKVDEVKPELKNEKDDKLVEVDASVKEELLKDDDIMVQATDDVVEQAPKVDVNQADKKASMKEALEKAGLSEKEMDTLNVTVSEVSNSSTDLSNGFGSQSNAQEDITKLGLQAGNKTNQVHTADKNFAKAVDVAKGEEPKEITKNEILTQINNKMQAQNINGKSKITLMLTPESLGKVTIELTKGKNGMEAKMLTDNAQVKELLEKSIDGLKSALSDQGLIVNNVSVKVSSATNSSNEFSFNRESFNGEGNFEQNSNDTGDKKDEKGQFTNGKFDNGLETDGDVLADGEGEITLEDGIKVSSQMGNVDLEA